MLGITSLLGYTIGGLILIAFRKRISEWTLEREDMEMKNIHKMYDFCLYFILINTVIMVLIFAIFLIVGNDNWISVLLFFAGFNFLLSAIIVYEQCLLKEFTDNGGG